MRTNNFKELEKQEIKNLDNAVGRVKSNVKRNLNMFSFIGDMAELFIPKIFGLLLNMMGRKDKTEQFPRDRYSNTRE